MNEGLVLGVGFLFVVIAASRRSGGAALGVLIMSMLVWPELLRVPLGIVQMSVPRFVAIALLAKFVASGRHRLMSYGRADTIAIALWVWTVLANVFADAEFRDVSQQIGRGLDTLLMYIIARMALVEPKEVADMFRWLAATAIIMCVAGLYEAITWSSPYHQFTKGLERVSGYSEIRLGLLRASASTYVSIYFGEAMLFVAALILSIRGYVATGLHYKFAVAAAFVAILTCLSSGPWIAAVSFLIVNSFIKKPQLIKPSLYGILALVVFAEIASNRHFYQLIDHLALEPLTAWYRARLLEVAFSRLEEYWLFGVGSNFPRHWGALIDGRRTVDVVNHFLIVALYGGLPALLLYVALHFLALKSCVRTWRASQDVARRKMVFTLAATLIAIDFSSMSVSLFGPSLLLVSILPGIMVTVSTALPWQRANDRKEPLQGFQSLRFV